MRPMRGAIVLAVALASVSLVAGAAELPNLDLSLEHSRDPRGNLPLLRAAKSPSFDHPLRRLDRSAVAASDLGIVTPFDSGLGAHSFVWAERREVRAARYLPLKSPRERLDRAALDFLGRHAAALGLSKPALAQARVFDRHLRPGGAAIVRFKQFHRGLPVFGRRLGVLFDGNGAALAASGYFASQPDALAAPPRAEVFRLSLRAVSRIALEDLRRAAERRADRVRQRAPAAGGEGVRIRPQRMKYAARKAPRSRPVYFPLPEEGLIPAFYLEIEAGYPGRELDSYAYVISSEDGRILFRKNLRADEAFGYRVFADGEEPYTPWENPLGPGLNPLLNPAAPDQAYSRLPAVPNFVTLAQGPIRSEDPWLSAGATTTAGNNVDAYLDLAPPDGFTVDSADTRGLASAPSSFDYLHRADLLPNSATQRQAAVSQLFYTLNFLHDWWYGNGFDEAAGNAQFDNFGRGGVPGDPIVAEAQDFSGVNNANMTTPADGASPRLQMYLFPGAFAFTVDAPAPLAGQKPSSTALFGPQVFDLSAPLASLVDAADAAGPQTTDGCSAATNAAQVAGRIALVSDGACSYKTKARNAQAAGANGVVVAALSGTTQPSGQPQMGDDGSAGAITIPVMGIPHADAEALRVAMASAEVRVRLRRDGLDSALDNGLIAHEWFHYLSNRLIGDASGLTNAQGLALGEGWSDFSALLLSVREDDRLVPGNENFGGAYSIAGYLSDSLYFGFRRAPYSTDFNLYPLSFRHIADRNLYEGTVPFRPKTRNAQIHNAGEIWANTLWEIYAALLNDPRYGFAQARERMKDYIVAGLRMTPNAPTFTEARDALLAVALATDRADFELMSRAFAKRGMGLYARSPERTSTDHAGVVESFALVPAFELREVRLDMDAPESGPGPCDADQVLDVGETGLLHVKIRNRGSAALLGARASLSPVEGVRFGSDGGLSFPDIAPGAEGEANIAITLDRAASAATLEFRLHFPQVGDDADAVVEPADQTFELQVDFDGSPHARDLDDLSQPAATLADWSRSAAPGLGGWQIVDAPAGLGGGKAWLGPDNDLAGHIYLTTPELSVDPAQALVLEFDQAYDFEAGYDGGRIEISSDGGASWTEVLEAGGTLSVPYGATPMVFPAGAYSGQRSSLQHVRLAFAPGAYSGDRLRLRFHVATDASVGAGGWLIDNVRLSGLRSRAFSSVGPDIHRCAPRVVEFVAKSSSVGEAAGTASIELRLSDPALETVRVPLSVGGSAGTEDYQLPAGSEVLIAPGQSRGAIEVDILDDGLIEGEETLVFTIGEPVGATAGTVLTHSLTLRDDDAQTAGTVRFGASNYRAKESAGAVVLKIGRSDPSVAASVVVATAGGTAAAGRDYLELTQVLSWAAGEEGGKTVRIELIDDALDEDAESIRVQLSSPVGFTLGTPATAFVRIEDDDDVAPELDRTPEPFAFQDAANVAPGRVQTSNAITVRGINAPAALSVQGGSYSLNGAAFTSASGQARNGDTVRLRHTSADAPATSVQTRLVIGGVGATFTSTTAAADTRPDAFHFVDQRGVKARKDIYSNTVTIRGLGAGISVPVILSSGPGGDARYAINEGGFGDKPGRVRNGDRLRLRNRIAETGGSARAQISVGGYSDTWTIDTAK